MVDTMDNLSDPFLDLGGLLWYKQFVKKWFLYLIYAEPHLWNEEVFKDFKICYHDRWIKYFDLNYLK